MDRPAILKTLLLVAITCVFTSGAAARGRIGAGYLAGGTTRTDAVGSQKYIAQGPLFYTRWSIDFSYYLDLDFGAEWRYQTIKFPDGGSIHPLSGLPAGERFNEEYITVPLNLNFITSTEDLGALRFLDYVGAYAGPRLDWCILSHDGFDRSSSFLKRDDLAYRPLNVLAGIGIYVIKGKWSFTITADHGFLDRCTKDDVTITNDWFASFRIGFEFGK
ncbi:MAG: hypothetical protein IJV01_03265 [Bacteroidales bacterium]|nr:hypothetical protein [Bacteroidales bacterium]